MKAKYETPCVVAEVFVPNEYIATCYKIKCNVPEGFGYIDNDNDGVYDSKDHRHNGVYYKADTYLASGDGCGIYHNAGNLPSQLTANSMWHYNDRKKDIPTFYWYQEALGKQSIHFTKIGSQEWEKNPNAS